jgi:predicted RNA-binding Zn ribbon-like protein
MAEMKFIAGSLCLDFVNTVGGRVTGQDIVLLDKLKDYPDLATWSRLAGLSTAHEVRRLERVALRYPARAAATLGRATKLREALYRILKSILGRSAPDDFDVDILRNELSIARAHERLVRTRARFAWAWGQSDNAVDSPLWRVSRSAADLLTSTDLGKLRQCGGDECGWLFLDTSRNHSRRWCDMKDCGNRAKVRRFRRREGHRSKHSHY